MENASKALIIAGAILISILLISVGIMVFNAVRNPAERATNESNSQEVQMFNAQFSSYEGTGKKGSALRDLSSKIQVSNSQNTGHQVNPAGLIGLDPAQSSARLDATTNYDVSFGYDVQGYIQTITVQRTP